MANAFKGEVRLSHDGRDYTMVLDFNALCDFEDQTGKNALETLTGLEAGKVSARDLRALAWAGLKQRQPDIDLQTAGQILGANPDAIARAGAAMAPEAEPGNANPPKAGR